MQTIYIADDEQNIRELIATFLKSDGFEVYTFENGDKLLTAFSEKPADMVILDIMMPGQDGLTLCTKIREKSNVPIIIVSARDSELDRITGITLGSDDYLTKPFSPMELVARVKAIFRRLERTEMDNVSIFNLGNMELNISTRSAKINQNSFEMTPTEFALITYLFDNRKRAISRGELLKNVWKYDFEVDTRATDDVVKRLRKKLLVANSTVKIAPVWGFGYKLEVEV